MKAKLAKRAVAIDGKSELFYPIKKGQLVLFNDKLIVQAIFGSHIQAKLRANTIGLEQFEKDLKKAFKKDKYITLWTGRKILVDSPHKLLNYSCQGNGGQAMKVYLTVIHRRFKEANLQWGRDFIQQVCIYDEVDLIVHPDHVDTVKYILESSFEETSRILKMQVTYTGTCAVGKSWHECH